MTIRSELDTFRPGHEHAPVLVLASASPRRHALLRWLDVGFVVDAADIDETVRVGEAPAALVRRLAREKGATVAARRRDAWVLAADTIVEIDGMILGKPADPAEAVAMLSGLAGREHRVFTGYALLRPRGGLVHDAVVTTRVRFRQLGPAAIEAYVATGEFDGKAGAYAIQGAGWGLIASIDGSFTNVIGLPLDEVEQTLREAGVLGG
jgi:septum formation protein